MVETTERRFEDWIRALVDQICDREGIGRQALAQRLGVHLHSISTAAYRGEIGCELALRLASLADATPDEKKQIELAWLRTKSSKRRDDAFRRAMDLADSLLQEVEKIESWLSRRGLLESYLAENPRTERAIRAAE